MADKNKFEIICKYKDANPSNVNEIFESYGCSTLEAKVPIVDNKDVEKVKNANHEQQKLGALHFKSESGTNVMEGRIARTRDRQLTLVEIGKETVIAAGKQRERSPVDLGELDDDLEEYMRKTAELKAQRNKAREELRERAMVLPDVPMIAQMDDPDW